MELVGMLREVVGNSLGPVLTLVDPEFLGLHLHLVLEKINKQLELELRLSRLLLPRWREGLGL
jgi:hypothetical protein